MTRRERVRYEMLVRVNDFGRAHRDLFPESSLGGQTFAEVAEAVTSIESHVTTKLLAAKESRRVKVVARAALADAMRAISRTARSIEPRPPKGEDKLQMPLNRADAVLIREARAVETAVEAIQDQFVARGLPPTFVADLRQAADTFEETMLGRRAGRTDVAGAQKGITAGLKRGSRALATLDPIVINVIGKDDVLLAMWKRSRRVIAGASKPATKPETPAVTPAAQDKEDSPIDPMRKVS